MPPLGGSGIEEIGAALNSSASAAKNTVFRSVQKLRKALEPFVEQRGGQEQWERNYETSEGRRMIAYHDGQAAGRETIAKHLGIARNARKNSRSIDALLAALNTIPVPEPGDDYGQRVWQRISPRLPHRRGHWWDFLFANRTVLPGSRRVAGLRAGAIVALVLAHLLRGALPKLLTSPRYSLCRNRLLTPR